MAKLESVLILNNSIRYKGNSNTSVIIFRNQKVPAMVLCLRRTSSDVFVMLLFVFDFHLAVVSSFYFWPSFCCCIFICWYSSFCFCCSSFTFSFRLPRALQPWVGIFYPQACFTLLSFTNILTCVYQGFPGSLVSLVQSKDY